MKTLLILLFPLLTFGQRQTYEHGLKMQSGFYGVYTLNVCTFEAFKGGKEITLKIHTKKPIIGGVILTSHSVERYGLKIDGVNKNGFYIVKLPFYMLDLWEAIDNEIQSISFNTGMQFETIIINDNLTKLKEYAK
jgi:hypothetical protein